VRDDGGASTDATRRSAEVDQVAAAREWLRRHGVDPGDGVGAGREAGAHHEVGTGPRLEAKSGATRPAGPEVAFETDGSDGAVGGGRRASGRADTGRGSRRQHASRRAAPGRGFGDPGAGRGTEALDPDADPEELARGIVLRKLAVQARTRGELERALKDKAVPEEAAATVLDRMGEVGLVDDATFARDWVASRQQRRHLSKTALRRELQTKGVDRELIDHALADVAGADEHEAALDLARRRAATMHGLAREVAYRRLAGVLGRRGFSSSITTRVLAEVLDGTDED
jgi:regulatory protein